MAFDTATANKTGKQYLYTGRGPLDPKSLIDTYAQLINKATWTEGTSVIAYNGMIAAVWNNTADTSKNGIYFLHDATVTSKFKAPDVTIEANWHKLSDIDSLSGLADQIVSIQTGLENLQKEVSDLESGGFGNLTSVDGTINITDTEDNTKSLSVAIAPVAGNTLTAVSGGLFVPPTRLAEDNHGLAMINDTLTLNLATKDSDGAMSKEDKSIIDAIPGTYATSEEVDALNVAISDLEGSLLWGEM